ncbi:uncharacterized protein HMPREF1541_06145 [Cyphellophora europaea CBS 101466]|uniref:F-box domain-containing protein n=1 Tax=Cyphellophora europaea (strain CBS 101466) TaxID=1220924 RepID=W2RVZ2_CYPE1|nr:uncharacterized protein HMPREF1541_06145 [Cyphellophora europaea CBS 101466]ETN39918.1 hypothetical protein HMPREF1541_06145 [Cyphellophora europaea CBS 101466]
MSASKKAKLEPEEATIILAKKTQSARDQIRGLVNSLPDQQAEAIIAILNSPEQNENGEQDTGFVWDKLPAEVKNTIYRLIFVSNKPIKPHINWPNLIHRRHINKFDLGAQFLRCSKAIYAEAHPILRSENVFEIGVHFRTCLGEDKNSLNSSLIRKAIVRAEKYSSTIHGAFMRLPKIEELTIVSPLPWVGYEAKANIKDNVVKSWDRVDLRLKYQIRHGYYSWQKPTKVYYVAERAFEAPAGQNNRMALRFEVKYSNRGPKGSIFDDEDDDDHIDIDLSTSEGDDQVWHNGPYDFTLVKSKEYFVRGEWNWPELPRI